MAVLKSKIGFISKHLLDIYELAKAGQSNMQIAKMVGVSWPTFRDKWMKKKIVLDALTRGRKVDQTASTFREYVYKNLEDDLRVIWDEIMDCDKAKTPLARMEAKLKSAGKMGRQNLFLYALVHTNFNFSEALRLCNISRSIVERWIAQDPDFGRLMDEIEWHKKNFFEGALTALVKEGHPGAVLFVNKTYNADRGYGPQRKVIDKNVNVSVKGGLENHTTKTIKLDDLDLPIEQRKNILRALREKKQTTEGSDD